jgi:NADPH-dependent 2,4-dienoyl-CoA reductase/sulfur reductase-like enzyme
MTGMTGELGTVCVVGASLAGLNAAETLRREGFDGRLVLVGDEPHAPYDRPPLSKQLLRGEWEPERTALRTPDAIDELGAEWLLGTRATALDLDARHVTLDDGSRIDFDGLVIATGATPRRLPGTPDLAGVFVLRTLDDSLALAGALEGAAHLVVVGAGFIGLEVAASARALGVETTVVEVAPVPLAHAVGAAVGAGLARLHADHGVDLRCGVGVEGLDGRDGAVAAVRLSDGSVVEADVVVIGVGVRPQTDWLEGSGLALDDGVVCDATCAAAPGVVAAGDVARWPNPLFGETMRVEHWDNAVQQGVAAARRLLAGPDAAEPFAPVPYFWSDQYDRKIQFVGRPGDHAEVVAGSPADERFVVAYGREGRLVGALSVKSARTLADLRAMIAERAQFEAAVAAARS